jgi:hypothetical protein
MRFRETVSTVVDINEKLTTFPVLREKNLIKLVITQDYTLQKASGKLTLPKYSCK